ncbi:vWA domain-containing protein [Nitrosovibrio tenuis]|uniref:von Willebrand factor type A domain-containing protein n=1 Tax=Nitrosovibrio tenuis TaxID=1233 RepID=A0A1H7MN65_9PROT|nr:vWA domain-containing protein [Nitrosovibrio tenuis]SEL12736.1 von Willebrand factor type A domain-containing protein [Nitrosovibrio tenuis]
MAINQIRFFGLSRTIPIALRKGLICLLTVAAMTSIFGVSLAATMQLISVKEVSPGVVLATVRLLTAELPNASDFWLRFNGKSAIRAKEVKPAQSVPPETSVIFCIDQSTSMGQPHIQQIQKALKDVVCDPESPLNAAVWVFDSEVTKLRGFSRDGPEFAADIDEIGTGHGRDGKTRLYEAIELALSELGNYRTKGPKRLILITAGKDNGSSITEQVVINEANIQNIAIDAVAFGNVSDAGSELLARLADDTNGRFSSPMNSQQLARELRKLLDLTPSHAVEVLFQYDIAEELHRIGSAQLEFAPDGQPPMLLTIKQGLSVPWLAPFAGDLPTHPASKEEINRLIFLWITIGTIGFLAAYLVSRRRAKRSP